MGFPNLESALWNMEGKKENLEEFLVKNYHYEEAILVIFCCGKV